ncbi:MAG: DNA-directed RNA polymerase subunit omega [Deinococcaceae bacterium]
MAEKNIDRLLAQAGSKYRLSVLVAKRALQLKAGSPSVLPSDQRAGFRNLVTVAMRELATQKLITGDHFLDEERLNSDLLRQKQQAQKAAFERSQVSEI